MATFQTKYDEHVKQFTATQGTVANNVKLFTPIQDNIKNIHSAINTFFGTPPAIVPKLIKIKDFMSKIATFQTQYNEHVKQFAALRTELISISL